MIKARLPPRCVKCWKVGHATVDCPTNGAPKAYGLNRHPAIKSISITPRRRHAIDDPRRLSSLPPTVSRLHDGPTAEQLIAWVRERRRAGA